MSFRSAMSVPANDETEEWRAAQHAIARGAGAEEAKITSELWELDAAIVGTSPDELAELRGLVAGNA